MKGSGARMGRNEYAIKLPDPLPQNLREKKGLLARESLDRQCFRGLFVCLRQRSVKKAKNGFSRDARKNRT
jgi:hypothetical protein